MRESVAINLAERKDTTEELVGVLTAISVVSRRLAKRLAQLEASQPTGRRRERDDTATAPPAD